MVRLGSFRNNKTGAPFEALGEAPGPGSCLAQTGAAGAGSATADLEAMRDQTRPLMRVDRMGLNERRVQAQGLEGV